MSRLRGHLNIKSINPDPEEGKEKLFMGRPKVPPQNGPKPKVQMKIEPVLMIRRAVLLRSLLERTSASFSTRIPRRRELILT